MIEYLPTLQTRQKWLLECDNLEVSDVVLVVDNTAPRCKWLTGKITETFPDKRGFVRQVMVKTKLGIVKRPIAKLCLIYKHE